MTNTDRYYEKSEIEKYNCIYVKLPLRGHAIAPTPREVRQFLITCDDFVRKNPQLYIGKLYLFFYI